MACHMPPSLVIAAHVELFVDAGAAHGTEGTGVVSGLVLDIAGAAPPRVTA